MSFLPMSIHYSIFSKERKKLTKKKLTKNMNKKLKHSRSTYNAVGFKGI